MLTRIRTAAADHYAARADQILDDVWADVTNLAELADIDWLEAHEIIMGTSSGQLRAATFRLCDALAEALRP